ncbi:endo-1,4-beta-xylanase [Streptomyces europaeiscabiei]|uniref:endo-1,4-beta-xylanase n=1 Tax=Streptomyces europaeiscabiei TaxID=146819 RepID=UPI002E2E3A1B|nr:endo-1,4-beta-xylanase [Streptomyces europaeiscabiei]
MKWDATERSCGSFAFGPADQIVNRARARGRRVRGQTPVRHSQLLLSASVPPGSTHDRHEHQLCDSNRWMGPVPTVMPSLVTGIDRGRRQVLLGCRALPPVVTLAAPPLP